MVKPDNQHRPDLHLPGLPNKERPATQVPPGHRQVF